ncbi:CRISPR-associated endonuclease Cas2 [bacterium]|nr:CRISPR-associated endonuclease Cas2 [bacterium]MBU1956928.1 CRISPR-associated endonuclease Cas2 [bacterium]
MKLLLTYDISNTKNRTKVATLLESYGYRVNFSVFELDIKKPKLEALLKSIKKLCDKHDSVRIYAFSADTIEKSYDLNPKRPNPFEKKSSYVN